MSTINLPAGLKAGLMLISLGLAACSGGGGNPQQAPQTPPAAPELSLDYSPVKTFRFTWPDVAGETEYRLLENPDGVSGYTPVATLAADSTGHDLVVSLPGRINARYLLQACNGAGCTDSAEVTVDVLAITAAIGYVKASNTDAGDGFGGAMALSADGRTLVVGANEEDSGGSNEADDSTPNAGAVYVYSLDGDSWSQQAYLKASNADSEDSFGSAVALSADGNTLAVGATDEDGDGSDAGDNSALNAGAVYLYTRSGDSWSQQAYLKAADATNGDRFGGSVALSADGATLAVGARYKNTNSGAVYVFTRDDGLWLNLGDNNAPNEGSGPWSQQAYLEAAFPDTNDWFGGSLALSADGNLLAVGATGEASNATGVSPPGLGANLAMSNDDADSAGAVYLYRRNGETWSQEAYVKASNTDKIDAFGTAVALSADGKTLAVGANREDSWATGVNGNEDANSFSSAGAVYLYRFDGQSWGQEAYIKASNTDSSDVFGGAVALSADGNTLAVGASREDSSANGINGDASDNSATGNGAGAVYLYRYDDGAWGQRAYVKASNTDANARFGITVALSDNGDTLAVGAYEETSAATGLNGDQTDVTAPGAGAVYLY
ncbi:MAG TPA: integrin [Gammaproteobacteria bacterium]|nr:integrin [Gammaproteobacteria bacterium]